jgi:hypothetical protein
MRMTIGACCVGSLLVTSLIGSATAFAQSDQAVRAPATMPAPAQAAPVSGGPANYPPPPPGYYYPPPLVAPPAPGPRPTLGIGYKIGNGVGLVGGDIVINPINHVSLDLQANYASVATSVGTASGFALVPGLQLHLKARQESSPYIGAAFIYLKLSANDESVSATAAAFNAGYEWKWNSGLGILLGGGVAHMMNVSASNGVTYSGKGTFLNIEFGVRYMFM